MVPAYRNRKKPSKLRLLWRLLWRLVWRSVAAAVVLVVALVAALRFVDPPTTAFMLGARVEAWRQGSILVIEHRWTTAPCLPDSLRLAVIAAEDQKFPTHRGFDLTQIADALDEARSGGRLRGASTLSQQTAKNLFLWPGQSWVRKGLEAGFTVLLEVFWPKRRILEVYLNVAEFGPGVYGVEAAARRFYDKPARRLSDAESAMLAAVLPSPRRFAPAAPSAYLRERQRWILRQMSQVRGLPGVAGLMSGPGACSDDR